MQRSAALAGLALVALCAAVVGWKTLALDMPLLPSEAQNLWRVEVEVQARGAGRGIVRARIPSSDEGQLIYDERSASDGLLFAIRSEAAGRAGVWSGQMDGRRTLSYGFRVQLSPRRALGDLDTGEFPSQAVVERYGWTSGGIPADAPEIAATLQSLDAFASDDLPGRVRTLFGFVADEIELLPEASDDALLALATREANDEGKSRLLAALLRGAGVPARLAVGLRLAAPRASRETTWVDAWVGGDWVPLLPSAGRMGVLPDDLLVLSRGDTELVSGSGLEAMSHRYRVVREPLRADELAALMTPESAIFSWASLYRLPVATQQALRLLLLMPLAALIVAVFRNIVGIRTFGTFMPILIALALRDGALVSGLTMVGFVVAVGAVGRLGLDRLHLLLVPRLCVVLCIVILLIVLLSLLGYSLESRNLLTGVLFPIVILSMLVERFSVTVAEEGLREAFRLVAGSLLVATCAYPVFQSENLAQLVFGFPEAVFGAAGILVWIGGYTGYRLSELIRFRELVREPRA